MLKTRKRWVSLLVAVAMLAALLVPMVGTASAAAAGYSIVTTVPQFDATNDASANLETAAVQIKVDPAVASESTARIEALSGDGSQLTIKGALVSDPHYVSSVKINGSSIPVTVAASAYQIIGAKSFNFAFTPGVSAAMQTTSDTKAWINIKLYVDAKNAASGDIKLDIFNTGNQLIPNQTVIATAAGGSVTAALVGGTASIGEDTASNVTMRVTENSAGALKYGTETLKFKLPAGFKWSVATADKNFDYHSNGGPVGNLEIDSDPRTLYVNITQESTTSYVVDITAGIAVDDKDTAKKGDVSVSLDANNDATITPSDITVGNYGDYGVNVSVASVKNLIAGDNAEKTDLITIEETIAGSLIEGRNVTVEFPNTVKVVALENKSVSNISNTLPPIDGTSDKFSFPVTNPSATDKAKYQFKAKLSIQGNATGDLAATVSGAGIPDATSLKVAEVVAPVAVTSASGSVKIGVQGQDAPDITVTEAAAGAIQRNASGDALELVLPSGVNWAAEPTVEVTAGDIDLDTDNITINNSSQVNSNLGSDDAVLRIPVKSASVTASTIKISGIKLTVDRTAPEGQLSVKITGLGVVVNYQNPNDTATLKDQEFATDNAGSFVIAKVVTPAPGEASGTAVFKIGDTSYTLNGVTATLDAPPYIKSGRTLLPVRAIANAVGVADSNIIWDPAGKVTVIKGDRVVQLTIGSNVMLVNGAAITIEVAPEITAGRTFLPLRALAQALSAGIAWDETAQTVTVTF